MVWANRSGQEELEVCKLSVFREQYNIKLYPKDKMLQLLKSQAAAGLFSPLLHPIVNTVPESRP